VGNFTAHDDEGKVNRLKEAEFGLNLFQFHRTKRNTEKFLSASSDKSGIPWLILV
jgi:hypothetical protein